MTSRQRGVLRLLAGFAGVTVVCSVLVAAQVGSSPGVLRTSADSSSSASNSSSDDNNSAAYLARGYASTMDEDEQRLTIMTNSLLTESVCDGEPMVILKSATVPANGACLAAQSTYNLSCSCLSGYANTTAWSFRVGVPDTEPMTPFPRVFSPESVIQVDSLMMLDVPPDLLIFGNDIENVTVTSDELVVISKLSQFEIDTSGSFHGNGSGCDSGEWQKVHNTNFCVVNSTNNDSITESVEGSGDDATNWAIFLLVAAFGGCLIGFLLFFLATKFVQYQQDHRRQKGLASPGVEDAQTSRAVDSTATQEFYNSLHPTLNAGLLHDPLIMSFRLKYKDLHVGRCISKGGFGLVYTGMYRHRRVAIKKIMREKCEKLSQIRMFIREITLMGTLKHERIVEFIGVAWDSLRNLSAVTEYMDRGDLRDVLHTLKHRGSNVDHGLTWQGKKLQIALHIAEGLAYMHSLNPKVIHRDLKSKNVLLNNEYEAKLSDFGVSRERLVADVSGGPGRFMTPGVGTSFWIAPEVLLGRDYDERADVFSFGVVLSEIDTDDYPYWNSGSIPAQDNPDERRSQEQKILEKVALGSLRPTFYNDCPPGVLALAASCLEGRPENRPSASEVVLTIKELMREMQFNSNRPRSEPEPNDIVTAGFLSSA
ncbi:unnamed protein product [Phytophthora fragariaefolia]|uniref:Unnamed protein product n=1 Tax=Phytophthora fragariaefolia TaxID=1490495 RepID=A0A9W6XKW8_9STRA|nr:unnamed protein product [Phytophthora fragariaefolia]